MKVLYWSASFWPQIGGVEVLSMQLIPALQKRGHEFAVVTSYGDGGLPAEEKCDGFRVHRFQLLSALANRDLKEIVAIEKGLLRLKGSFQPDLVHVNYTDPSVFFHLRTNSSPAVPTLVSLYALLEKGSSEDSLQARVLRAADWVAAPSRAVFEAAVQQVPEIAPRSSVIYPSSTAAGAPPPAPLPFEEPRLLCLGRLVPDKGFDLALEAFASLTARFPRARLIISGDGPARPALERQAAELGLSGAVEFTGWISRSPGPEGVLRLINTATVVVLPSRYEPFGLVALQAAQMGRPIVAARTGGLQEIVADRETGLLFESGQSAALAEAVAFLLDHPESARRIGRRARTRAGGEFGWDPLVVGYDALYLKLAANTRL